jgi:hypothetical protein
MQRPKRIWWARNKKLCALERPGGGGRTHRPDRRKAEITYLKKNGVRLVISTAPSRHNIDAYEQAKLDWHHVPVKSWDEAEAVLEELLPLLRRELKKAGAVAIHGELYTDFVAAVCAAYLHADRGRDPADALAEADEAGLVVTPEAASLLGVDYSAVHPRSRIAAAT